MSSEQPLKIYKEKRDFKQTPEPSGRIKSSRSKHLYVIQKHAASHLHYDFRLEMDGVLKSWAIPKGPSLDPTIKRLAVHVEDHPLTYGSFEGIIPKGQYGGGTVMLWDKGEWNDHSDPAKGYEKGDLTFELEGEKLKGLWKLICLKKDPKNWLLIKLDGKYACSESEYNITDEKPLSVISHKSIEELAGNYKDIWTKTGKKKASNKTTNIRSKKQNIKIDILSLPGVEKIKMPALIHPELATLVDNPPTTEKWLHEIKYDGYRLICFIKNSVTRMMTRNQNDWTTIVSPIVDALQRLNLDTAILDGELVALNENGEMDFQLLQNTLHSDNQKHLHYHVFDLVYYAGYSLLKTPLIERKKLLEQLIPTENEFQIKYSDHVIGDGKLVFEKACQLGLEGIVSKDINSHYLQKRTKQWLKAKCVTRQEFVIGGYTKPQGSRSYFGSLLLGFYPDKHHKQLQYCGHVGTGFNQSSLQAVYALLKANTTNRMPFSQKPPKSQNIQWVKPKIVCEIDFAQWTHDQILRHPSFKGLREDKSPREVILEIPNHLQETKPKKNKGKAMDTKQNKTNYLLSNPDRILYPDQGITKQQLANYYLSVSEFILPHIVNRPLTLVRCPQGIGEKCFFQKHIADALPKGIYGIDIEEKHGKEKYLYIQDEVGLVALVQMGVLEIHPWGCRINNIEKPDLIVFDLDPSEDVAWSKVVQTAKLLQQQLENIDLVSFVKTTGGKGLHVVLPLKSHSIWSETVAFAHAFTNLIVNQNPEEYIGTMSKTKRKGKIFIDYLRNNRGATAVAPYSTRARPNATVATPLSWKELSTKTKSNTYNIDNLPNRLAKLKNDSVERFFYSTANDSE